jgi:trans-2,3-dihydro-3-hydroxyanthranilate isomerase
MSGQCAAGTIILEEGVGPVPVAVEQQSDRFSGKLTLDKAPELRDDAPTPEDIAAVISLPPDEVRRVFCASVGVNFTFVQLHSREAVDRSQLDHQAWTRLLSNSWAPQVYVFAGELTNGAELHARMYAPALGIAEDPATGSAVAPLVAVAANSAVSHEIDRFELSVMQGVAMGRPSLLTATARMEQGRIKYLDVGGSCAFVAQGQIDVPERFLEQS